MSAESEDKVGLLSGDVWRRGWRLHCSYLEFVWVVPRVIALRWWSGRTLHQDKRKRTSWNSCQVFLTVYLTGLHGIEVKERLWREVVAAWFEALKGLWRIAEKLDLNSQSPGLNLGPSLYEVGHNVRCHLLQVQPECS